MISMLALRRKLLPLAALLWLGGATLSPLTVRADDVDPAAVEDARDAAESRSATFQAVSGGQGEDVPGGPLLVAAYGAVLALVLGYVLHLGRLTAGASRDLDRLETALKSKDAGGARSDRGDRLADEIARKEAATDRP